jgi:hypothetical protein
VSLFQKTYNILIEQLEGDGVYAYDYLESNSAMSRMLGKKSSYWDFIRSFYIGAGIDKEKVDDLINQKRNAAKIDNNPYFIKLLEKPVYILNRQDAEKYFSTVDNPEELKSTLAIYEPNIDAIMFNPNAKFESPNKILESLYHELTHARQDFKSGDTVRNLINPDTEAPKVHWKPNDGDTDLNHLLYTTSPAEMDPHLANINKVVAIVFKDTILPNEKDKAMKYLNWFIDPANLNKIPKEMHYSVNALSTYIDYLDRRPDIMNQLVQRIGLLAKNTNKNYSTYI